MIAVLFDYLKSDLSEMSLLNVGGSAGIIDAYLANHIGQVTSVDIDRKAIEFAEKNNRQSNLRFQVGDAMNLQFAEQSFDIVVCSQVYEHVPDASVMMNEIYRVLKPGGVCYFAAGNRIMWNEPHYRLPLLSVLPRALSHMYMPITGKGDYYYEKHLSYWGLKKLTREFDVIEYTKKIIDDPKQFHADYMLKPGSRKLKLARLISRVAYWLVPGYIWLLRKH